MLGAVGLTDDSAQLLRCMVCGSEIARCVCEFEASLPYYQQENEFEYKNHEKASSRQQRFFTQVLCLVQVIRNMGNPFLEKSEDLLVLDARSIANKKVVNTKSLIEFSDLVNSRLKSLKKV